jgi:lipopolysaccharide transport system permease protein
MFSLIASNRYLLLQLLKREVLQRYRGSHLGFFWAFAYPVLMLLVYMFVFGTVMKLRWGVGEQTSTVQYGLVLFSGLVMHGLLAEVFTGSTRLIISNVQYVKKVVFPLPILSVVTLLNALIHNCFGLLILFVALLVTGNGIPVTVLYLPLVILPFALMMLGFSWLLSALGVFVRDLSQVIGVLVTVLLFIGPIVYPLRLIPEQYQNWVLFGNPLSIVVEQLRLVVLDGVAPDWGLLAIYYGMAVFVLWIGYWFFTKTSNGFADVV